MSAPGAHSLVPLLKELRLNGMQETLEARLSEARTAKLSHVELLSVLFQDEIARRNGARVERLVRAARFPVQATLEGFDFAANAKVPAELIRDLSRLEFVEAGEGVVLYGPVGVGKSHIAAALGHIACRRGYEVLFTTCSRLLAELAGGHADRSFDARLARLARPTILIIDDFAMREFTVNQADDFYELLTARLGRPRRSIVLTSNRAPSDWYSLFPNAVVGESILDRLLNSCHHVLMEGKSYRPNRRPGTRATRP
ncbi:MAG TPA: IS21-like element helper ATPase IstB [Acidimicrobiales bacterium]|nr:IS21-like element helper ATPase IstB [Acidimicrobiales bacterium]